MRTVLKSLLDADSDSHAASVVASRVAFALEIMCQQPEEADSCSAAHGSSKASAHSEDAALPDRRVQPPETAANNGSERVCPSSRVDVLATPRGSARQHSRPSAQTAPGTQVKVAKPDKPSRTPFVPAVSSSSAAAAAANSARSTRRTRVKQLRLFPDPQPGSATKGDTPGYLRERSLETRQARRVRGNAAQNFAATTVAACWRGYVARTCASRVRAAKVVQREWRLFQSRMKLAKLRQAAAHRRRARELALEVQRAEAESLAARQRQELEWRKRSQQAQEKLRLAASQFGLSGESRPR
jgi:hypothetical protein